MKHIPLIVIFLAIIVFSCCFTWKKLARPGGDEAIVQSIKTDVETVCYLTEIPIRNSGLIFGRKIASGLKQLTGDDLKIIRIKKLEKFLNRKPPLVNMGWVVGKYRKLIIWATVKTSKIYWITSGDVLYYYYPNQKYKVEGKSVFAPEILKKYPSVRWWVIIIIIVEVLAGIFTLYWTDYKIFNGRW